MKSFFVLISVLIFLNDIYSQTGINRSFYPDGKISSEISYVNDRLDGTCYWFYENGNLRKEVTYSNGIVNGWIREYYLNGIIKSEIQTDMGILDGLSKYYYENGGLKETRIYEKGKLISTNFVSLDPNYAAPISRYFTEISGIKNSSRRKEEYICPIDICPEPVSGIESIIETLIYPEDAKKYGLEGTVSVLAQIDEQGNVRDAQVVKGIGLGCDEAAIDAVKKTKFIPGQDKEEVVSTQVILYIPFLLTPKKNLTTSNSQGVQRNNVITEKKHNVKKQTEKKEGISLEIKDLSCDANECPFPEGGMDAVIENVFISPENRAEDYKGILELFIKIDEEGNVYYSKITKNISRKIDENIEAAIIITKFIPAKINGKKVSSELMLSVEASID
ncbi:MAG: TonB family protein [Ignavibacteria bacterium]|mgnify:CR=1 FL=1|nr:TonB family protein [Ignavibacteria bacterium]